MTGATVEIRLAAVERDELRDPWLNALRAAKLLGMSESYVRYLCKTSAIRHQRVGKRYRLRLSWVDAYLSTINYGPGGAP